MARFGSMSFLATAVVVCGGLALIASEKAVRTKGVEVVVEPVKDALQSLRPVGRTISETLSGWIGRQPGGLTSAETNEALSPAESPMVASSAKPEVDSETSGQEAAAPGARPVPQAGAPPSDEAVLGVARRKSAQAQIAHGCAAGSGSVDIVVIGDRIQLRLFERSALAAAPGKPAGGGSDEILFERLDLSGAYEVGASGSVSLPAIGHVEVAGRDLLCAEELITRAASEKMRLRAVVSAAFASRPPVLVRGAVRAPGAHPYTPGMTVERVLAQAGALDAKAEVGRTQRAALRARQNELMALSASLMVEQSRIEATLRGERSLQIDPEKLRLVTEMLSPKRIEIEQEMLAADLEAQAAAEERNQARLEDLRAAIDGATAQLKAARSHLAQLHKRRDELGALLDKGLVTDNRYETAVIKVMDMERLVLDKRDALGRLEAELRLAEYEVELSRSDWRRRLSDQARAIAKEKDAIRGQMDIIQAQLGEDDASEGRSLMVLIDRPDPGGDIRVEATFDTYVRPGDLVTVTYADERPAATAEMRMGAKGSGDHAFRGTLARF